MAEDDPYQVLLNKINKASNPSSKKEEIKANIRQRKTIENLQSEVEQYKKVETLCFCARYLPLFKFLV